MMETILALIAFAIGFGVAMWTARYIAMAILRLFLTDAQVPDEPAVSPIIKTILNHVKAWAQTIVTKLLDAIAPYEKPKRKLKRHDGETLDVIEPEN